MKKGILLFVISALFAGSALAGSVFEERTLESIDSAYYEEFMPGEVRSMTPIRVDSSRSCANYAGTYLDFLTSFGFSGTKVWVSSGCRALFKIEYMISDNRPGRGERWDPAPRRRDGDVHIPTPPRRRHRRDDRMKKCNHHLFNQWDVYVDEFPVIEWSKELACRYSKEDCEDAKSYYNKGHRFSCYRKKNIPEKVSCTQYKYHRRRGYMNSHTAYAFTSRRACRKAKKEFRCDQRNVVCQTTKRSRNVRELGRGGRIITRERETGRGRRRP